MTAYNPVMYTPFVQCIENGQQITPSQIDTCLAKHNIDAAKVDSCMKGPLGKVQGDAAHEGDYGPAEMDAWAAFAATTCARPARTRGVCVCFNNNESYAGKSEARLCSSLADATYLAGILNKAGGSSGSGTAAGVSTPPPSSPARVAAKKRQPRLRSCRRRTLPAAATATLSWL